jgi:DNA-binding PadR family transcriptional regulator
MSTLATTKTSLLLLGLLLDRPMHGYQLYQQIQAEGIDAWFNVSAAGVYYSLGKLRDRGLVAESRQRGRRSSRKSIYRLTEEGREAFFAALEAELASEERAYLDYDLAIYLLNKFPLQRAIPRLEEHQAFLAQEAQNLQLTLAKERDRGQSSLKLAILDHKCRFLEMESNWLADVMCSIRQNGTTGEAREGRRGLMILSGDLRHYHLPDLLRLIVSGRHSGTLTVTDGAEVRTLSFEEGRPVCASFLRRGDPEEPPVSREQVMERVCELFRWQEGQFTFDQTIGCQAWCVPIECSAEDLILRGCRKVDEWAIIQRLVPSSDTIFELGPAFPRVERLELAQSERRVVEAVDGVKDVATIARELDQTLFETSQACYCLTAIGVLRAADLDKIRLRRVFREMAELVCNSTLPWRSTPEDRTCEEEVNAQCSHLPLFLEKGRLRDQTDPQIGIDEMKEMYRLFLQNQLRVVSQRFGRTNARQAFARSLNQLSPELQDTAERYGFHRLTEN